MFESGVQTKVSATTEIYKSLNRWYWEPLACMRLPEKNVQDIKRIKDINIKESLYSRNGQRGKHKKS